VFLVLKWILTISIVGNQIKLVGNCTTYPQSLPVIIAVENARKSTRLACGYWIDCRHIYMTSA